MFAKRAADFVLANRVRAGLIALAASLLPLLSFVSFMVVGLVTLRKGLADGALVLVWAVVPSIALMISTGPSLTFYELVIFYVLLLALAEVLRRYSSWGVVLEIVIVLFVVMIVLAHLFVPDLQAWWSIHLNKMAQPIIQSVSQAEGQAGAKKMSESIALAARFGTGLSLSLIMLWSVIMLFLSRWWQAVVFNPGGLRKELLAFRLGRLVTIAFLICAVLAVFRNALAMDCLPIFVVGFAIVGLCTAHFLLSSLSLATLWLGLLYVSLILFAPYLVPVLAVAVVGLIDSFLDLKKLVRKRVV